MIIIIIMKKKKKNLCYEINNIGKYSNTCPIKSYVPNFTLHLLIRMFGITKMENSNEFD